LKGGHPRFRSCTFEYRIWSGGNDVLLPTGSRVFFLAPYSVLVLAWELVLYADCIYGGGLGTLASTTFDRDLLR